MTASNLPRSLEAIFGHEGGFTSDRRDPGNWTGGKVGSGVLKGTKFGISAASYPTIDIQKLTVENAVAIYRRDYAEKIAFDDLPGGVDHATLDFAINSGPRRAAKFLQHIAGVDEDGVVGPVTLKAVRALDPRLVINTLCDDRLAFLKGLPTWPTYGKGWSRRVSEVRALGLQLVTQPVVAPPPQPPSPSPHWLAAILLRVGAVLSAIFQRRT